MFLRFRAEGASEDALYEFRPDKTPRVRAAIAEKLYSKAAGERRTWEQLKADALQGGIAARTVALWIAMTDKHPSLRFEDLPDFDTGALVMEYSKEELRRMRGGIAESDSMLDSEKAAILAQVDRDIDTAPAGSDEPDPLPDPEVAELGKAEAEQPTGEVSTS